MSTFDINFNQVSTMLWYKKTQWIGTIRIFSEKTVAIIAE